MIVYHDILYADIFHEACLYFCLSCGCDTSRSVDNSWTAGCYHLPSSWYRHRLKWKKKSVKKMLNNNGPSIEPCTTLKTISNQEVKVLFTLALCFLFDKWSWTSFKAGKLNLYALSFAISSLWSRQSNALERPVNKAPKI